MKPPRSKCHLFYRDHQMDCAFKGRERARLPEFRDIPDGNADCASHANSILMPRTRLEFVGRYPTKSNNAAMQQALPLEVSALGNEPLVTCSKC